MWPRRVVRLQVISAHVANFAHQLIDLLKRQRWNTVGIFLIFVKLNFSKIKACLCTCVENQIKWQLSIIEVLYHHFCTQQCGHLRNWLNLLVNLILVIRSFTPCLNADFDKIPSVQTWYLITLINVFHSKYEGLWLLRLHWYYETDCIENNVLHTISISL